MASAMQGPRLRLCIVNEDAPGVLARIMAYCGDQRANVTNTVNKSGAEVAYTVMDVLLPPREGEGAAAAAAAAEALRVGVAALQGVHSCEMGRFGAAASLAPLGATAKLCIVNLNQPGVLARCVCTSCPPARPPAC